MKKEYISPEFELKKLMFEHLLTDLRNSNGEVGARDGDPDGLDE